MGGADAEWSCAPQGLAPHEEGVDQDWGGMEGSDAGSPAVRFGSEGESLGAERMPSDESCLSGWTGSEKSSTGCLSAESGAGEEVLPGCGEREVWPLTPGPARGEPRPRAPLVGPPRPRPRPPRPPCESVRSREAGWSFGLGVGGFLSFLVFTEPHCCA